ncbi:MAG: transposase [Microcoleus vaginatus WJT46-NPBG5]|nr:transposase [Microcoleus vaginatus WJT46-NPBG5]
MQLPLITWLRKADSVYETVLKITRNHLNKICIEFLNRTTSGFREGINHRLNLIKQHVYTFVNFYNSRTPLLACFPD